VKLVFCFARKTQRGPVKDLVDAYLGRIGKYLPVEVVEARELRLQARPGVHLVLDVTGVPMTSEDLASLMSRHLNASTRHMFFYTGGPDGLPAEVLEGANVVLSLSRMTFNHQLVRPMLLEQVYRGLTILRGEPYHRP